MDYLVPGRIFHLYCHFNGRNSKNKFVVLLDVDEECLFFVINSELTSFIQKRSHLMDSQIKMRAAEYSFLDYDSWLCCHEPFFMDRSEVVRQISSDPDGTLRGHISSELREEIVEVVKKSLTLEPLDKTLILQSLGG